MATRKYNKTPCVKGAPVFGAVSLLALSAVLVAGLGAAPALAETCLTGLNVEKDAVTTSSGGAHDHFFSGTTTTNGAHGHNTEINVDLPWPIPDIELDIPTTTNGDHAHNYSGTTESAGEHDHTIPAGMVVTDVTGTNSGAS